MDRVRERWNVQDKERFLKGEDEAKEDVNQIYVGKRVAKWFKDADANGSHYFKGTITKVFRGIVGKGDDTVLFHIEFDDGDEEDAEIEELDGKKVLRVLTACPIVSTFVSTFVSNQWLALSCFFSRVLPIQSF